MLKKIYTAATWVGLSTLPLIALAQGGLITRKNAGVPADIISPSGAGGLVGFSLTW